MGLTWRRTARTINRLKGADTLIPPGYLPHMPQSPGFLALSLQDKLGYGRKRGALIAYISESRDREGNTFYEAAISDDEKNEIINELSDYSREDLEKEILQRYPEIEIENG